MINDKFISYDGVEIPFNKIDNNNKKKVIILHAMFEHIDRYEEVMKILSKNNIDTYVIEYREHGKLKNNKYASFGDKGVTSVLNDIKLFIKKELKNTDINDIYILGNGLGSVIGLYLMENFSFKNIILMSLNIEKHLTLVFNMLLTKIENKLGIINSTHNNTSSILNRKFIKEGKYAWLNSNKEELKILLNDDLVYKKGLPIYFNNVYNLLYNVKKNIKKIDENANIFVLFGVEDPLVSETKLRKYMQKLNNNRRKIKILKINKARHDLLHEVNKNKIIEEIVKHILE